MSWLKVSVNIVQKNKLLAYLNPEEQSNLELDTNGKMEFSLQSKAIQPQKRRVIDRPDLQMLIPGFPTELA
jgi:hypothetical protein